MLNRLQKTLQARKLHMDNEADFQRSAVLIPLVFQDEKWNVLFEVRARDLQWQPGDICFPGGRVEFKDQTSAETVVRETVEELGIKREDIELLGPLDYVISPIMGVMVDPYAGIIHHPGKLNINTREVAEVFAVPLEFLLRKLPIIGHIEAGTRPSTDFPLDLLPESYEKDWKGRFKYPLHFYTYGDRVIWGLTARILYNFIQIIREDHTL